MGVWRTLLLGDWGNRMDIGDNENRIRRINRHIRKNQLGKRLKDQDQDKAIGTLQSEVDELKIALGTLTQILITREVLTEAELERADDILDEMDQAP